MSKKDYVAIARAINDGYSSIRAEMRGAMNTKTFAKTLLMIVASDLIPYFKADNNAFNEDRFVEACFKE